MTLRLNLFLASCMLALSLAAQFDPLKSDPIPAGPITMDQFEETEYDFGEVLQDSENFHVFKFKNTGTVPLVIENAQGSCGCTVPEYDKAPIPPGQVSEIRVVYKPGKQEGHQAKTVTITANSEPLRTIIRIKANVLQNGSAVMPSSDAVLKEHAEEEFIQILATEARPEDKAQFDPLLPPGPLMPSEPIATGPLTTIQFEGTEHDFGQVLQGSENPHVFKFTNTGNVPLMISNAQGSCGCTVPFYAKEPIPPGGKSEIHVVYKPGKQIGRQNKTVTITANILTVQTKLSITADVLKNDSAIAPSLFVLEEEHQQDQKAIEAVSPGCFVIFPNPTSNELRLDLKEHIGLSADVRIHDEMGKDMLQTRIPAISSESSRLDVASFPAGIYVVTIQVEGRQPMSQCFMVKR